MNPDLLTILEEVTTTLDQLLKSHGQLVESFYEDNQISQSKQKIEKRRADIEKERDRIRSIRDSIRHRREIDQLRKQHEDGAKRSTQSEATKKLETISDQGGRVVGYKLQHGKQTVYMNNKQRVVAREVGGNTFNKNGSFVGKGKQGMRALGMG